MSFEIGDMVCFPGRPEAYTVERIVPRRGWTGYNMKSWIELGEHVVMSRVTERGGVERISIDIEQIAHVSEE